MTHKTDTKAMITIARIFGLILVLLLTASALADVPTPTLKQVMQEGAALIDERIETQKLWAVTFTDELIKSYDAAHTNEPPLKYLFPVHLKILCRERTNALAPRLMLLTRELQDDRDCSAWFATLKEAYEISTNEEQRAVSLSQAFPSAFLLEPKKHGRPMLKEMKEWLAKISDTESIAMLKKVRGLQLCVALGLEEYANVPRYARDTPLETLTPLWMMSKGKWALALQEVQRLKGLRSTHFSIEEKAMLDKFESILTKLVEPKK